MLNYENRLQHPISDLICSHTPTRWASRCPAPAGPLELGDRARRGLRHGLEPAEAWGGALRGVRGCVQGVGVGGVRGA